MSQQLHDREFESVLALPGPDRYEYFVKRVVDGEQLWSLRNADGWVMAGDAQGREMIAVWPHERFAVACAAGDWQGTSPEPIALADWMEAWLPGMARDGLLVAVFPTPAGEGVPVTPDSLKDDLASEILEYE
jgi:hypothetical protein